MSAFVDLSGLYAAFLLSIRMSPVFFMTPMLGSTAIPGVVKGVLSIALSAMMVAVLDLHVMLPGNGLTLFFQASKELFMGLLLGFGVQVAFGSLSFAGRLLDTQIGFGLAGVINPMTHQNSALTGLIFELLGVAYLYAINGHYMLLLAFRSLLEDSPLGLPVDSDIAMTAVHQFGVLFVLGVSLAAPLMLTLFLMDVGIAIISRSMPQFNAFVMAMPVKVVAGVSLLALGLPLFGVFFERWLRSMLDYWTKFTGS